MNRLENLSMTSLPVCWKIHTDVDALLVMALADGTVVEQARQALIGKIGENVTVRRFALVEPAEGQVSGYVHGNRIGVLTVVTGVAEGPLGGTLQCMWPLAGQCV